MTKKAPFLSIDGIMKAFRSPAFWIFLVSVIVSIQVGKTPPQLSLQKATIDVKTDTTGRHYYIYKGKPSYIAEFTPLSEAELSPANITRFNQTHESPTKTIEYAYEEVIVNGTPTQVFYKLSTSKHWKYWSLLPAITAILLCWMTREPITALCSGIISGAFLLGQYDILHEVLIPELMTQGAASILVLYLWLLGGLMGVWSRTGAAHAFAEFMTHKFVRGPKTAKFVAWSLGVIFFQGGTVSTVLVGTTVKPLADEEKVSHEELSYIVDSTASPVAGIIAFNAWPGYVQALIFVAGVPFLLTEADRIAFFFRCIPLSFYCILAVFGTFLMCIDKNPFLGPKFKKAIERARTTGKLDAPGASPLSAKELQATHIPAHYTPHVLEFFIPLITLIGISIGTYMFMGSLQIHWAFGAALLVSMGLALVRGMKMNHLIQGIDTGMKGVALGALILILAITIGSISKAAGGGTYLVDLLGDKIPYWLLPLALATLTVIIAFSTGTSWGTYAVAFPLAMPLAWAVATTHNIANPELFLMVCFAAVMNGSIFGDQCSPISDTTVLSSMVTGCDLMDHVKTQIVPASAFMTIAIAMWTITVLVFT